MRVIFMGTPDFAVGTLEAIIEAGHEVVLVVTQPDKPKGRGNTVVFPPVKECALSHGIEVFQPQKIRLEENVENLRKYNPEIIVVAAFGQLLPKSILDMPKYGCINVHGSLLPEYRGAAPMQRAIIDGKTVTGITTMYMAEGLDTGDMLLKAELPIEENDNFEDIHDKLGTLGASLILDTLDALTDGTAVRIPQDDSVSTYAAKITKEDCLLDFGKDARSIHNLIRGLSPIPLSFTHTPDGKLLKVLEARINEEISENTNVGEVISLDGGITVACGKGSVTLLRVLPEGKPRMNASDFIRGRKIAIGDILK